MSLTISHFDGDSKESELVKAVRQFNELNSQIIDKQRTPITAEEVIAAIRAKVWRQMGNKTYHPDAHSQAILEAIAEDQAFPKGSHFSCMTKLSSGDFEIGVWYIDLRVNSQSEKQYQVRIRNQQVNSRRHSDEELSRMRGGPKFRDP